MRQRQPPFGVIDRVELPWIAVLGHGLLFSRCLANAVVGCYASPAMSAVIRGRAYVVRDNIDTDQIIPAQYLNLVPTISEEYEKLGSFALCGLPKDKYPTRYIPEGETKASYAIVIAGRNFGCGSSREHAPIALGAAGCQAVVAEGFARIFF